MNTQMILDYLSGLEQNNNSGWFHENKQSYQEAKQEFEELVFQLMMRLHETDKEILVTEPKKLTFKVQRDTRFSNDKSPYNPSFRAHISSKGKLPVPVGFFLMVQPQGRSFIGGGLFADMFRDATQMIRDYITYHGEEWEQIITNPEFQKYFKVAGTSLKKTPQGYDPEHPQAEYVRYKSWYLEYFLSDTELTAPDFVDKAVEIYKIMLPFNTFLNQALEQFKMPER